MDEVHEGSEVVRSVCGALDERTDNHGGRWLDGTVHTPAGSVEVSAFVEPDGRWQVVTFRTVVGGRLYRRWERRRRAVTARGLKMLARRWAAELAVRLERSESDGE